MKLVIGNKNYSSWSMRPWVLLRHFGIPFEEIKLRFDFTPDSDFYRQLAAYTPSGKVPVLMQDNGEAVWDSLAIMETVAEQHPELPIWPRDAKLRARARCLTAEMHSGFGQLRQHCIMNVEAWLPEVGLRIQSQEAGVRQDLQRLDAMWAEALAQSGGPFLFGEFCAADAFFAPVAIRISRYGLQLSPAAMAYVDALLASPGVIAWVNDAMAEHDFLDFEEPYRKAPAPHPAHP